MKKLKVRNNGENMVKKAFNKPERPPRVEGPPLRSYGGDEDRHIDDEYSYVRGNPSAGGGVIIICVVLIVFGILKIVGLI